MRVGTVVGLCCALLAVAPAAAGAACPNEAIREVQGSEVLALPDCMALEMVSPAKKGNQLARNPGPISADGTRLVFNSFAALDPTVPNYGGLTGDLFVATRSSSGWPTEGANVPYGSSGSVNAFLQVSFSSDFSGWFQVVEDSEEFFKVLREGSSNSFATITPPLKNLTGATTAPTFQGSSADHSHIYFKPDGNEPRSGTFLPGDPQPAGVGEDSNLYVAHLDSGGQPTLELAARDLNGKVWGANCGARLGGIEPITGTNLNLKNGNRNQGAISSDGSRVYFSTRPDQPASGNCTEANKKRIMVREETPSGPVISELITSECGRVVPTCSAADGDDSYQGASIDQTKVYFTTTRQLANSDLDGAATSCDVVIAVVGCDLYLYDSSKPAGERLTQVSAGDGTDPTPGTGARVYNSIAAISADGSRVYFVAQGVLTTDPSPKGVTAVTGSPNLYTWDVNSDEISFIGALNVGDGGSSGLWGSNGTWNNGAYAIPIEGVDPEVGGDGRVLLFKSKAPLTASDTDGAFRDVFRYDADARTLERVSRGEPGGSDNGTFDASPRFGSLLNIPPGTEYAAVGRPISEDGKTIEFTTVEGLLPGDTNGVEDAYLWRGGQIYRLPGSGQAINTPSNSPSLSSDGSTVAYHTTAQLLPSDGDTALDVYVARINGGFPNAVAHEGCQIDEGLPGSHCQEPKPSPVQPKPCTDCGDVNISPKPPCSKGKVRRHGKCVKKPHRKRHHRHHGRDAGAKQGSNP